MKSKENGYITLYLSLTLGIMLSLVFLLLEAVRNETIRTETETVMDIGLYSVFGEFHRQLLEQYDLFFIDTSYGEGRPDVKRLEEHLMGYMNKNFHKKKSTSWLEFRDLTNLSCDNVTMEAYLYASDMGGEVLKSQIVDSMQSKTGLEYLEAILSEFQVIKEKEQMDFMGEWKKADRKLKNLVEEKKKEMKEANPEEEEGIDLDNPADYVKEVQTQGILGLVLPREKPISSMIIHPEYYLTCRDISSGREGLSYEKMMLDQITEDFLLREYFMDKCGFYNAEKEHSLLKYQVEYLLYGNEGDLQNLEAAVEEILKIREVINFLYLLSDVKKMEEAESLAWVISAVLFSPEIKEVVKTTLLFAWSYAESVKDIRILLDGNKLPVLKTAESWNTPLSKLASFSSCLGEYTVTEEGICYEDYLRFFLFKQSEKELLYRFMDICEMDIRMTEGNEYFQMDGCIGAVKVKANVSSGYGNGYEITREYRYE